MGSSWKHGSCRPYGRVLTPPWYQSSAVFWGMYVPMNSKLIEFFNYYLNLLLNNIFSNSFQLLEKPWMTKTKKFLVLKNIFQKKYLQYFFKIEWRVFWGFFYWDITHFCRSQNKGKIFKFWYRENLNISKKSSE